MKWEDLNDQDKQALSGKIAKNLRNFGYRDVTGALVIDELGKPEGDRSVIGMFAVSMLEDNEVEV